MASSSERSRFPARATIEEVLTAFVRGHAPWPPTSPGQPDKDVALVDLQPPRSWAPDVQAALTVLGRRKPPAGQPQRLLLDATDLRHAYLRDADLRDAVFTAARLQGADLTRAKLEGAQCNATTVWPALRDRGNQE
jgi:hypothetical protein